MHKAKLRLIRIMHKVKLRIYLKLLMEKIKTENLFKIMHKAKLRIY